MNTLPHSSRKTSLTAAEREIILTIADDEEGWTIFTDSTRMTRKLLAVAARWGLRPERAGAGYQFTLPRAAVRFAGPVRVSERQRQAGRDALRNARLSAQTPAVSVGGETVGAAARGLGAAPPSPSCGSA